MKKKITAMLFVIAAFLSFTHTRLEALSAVPSQLCVGVTRGAINTTILSTNTLTANLDGDISTVAGAVDEQLIGFIEFNVSKGVSNTDSFKLAQNEPLPDILPASSNWAMLLIGQTSSASLIDPIIKWQALKIYSNVNTTNTGLGFVYTAPTALANASGKAILKTAGGAAYTMTNQIGLLSCYAVDDANNCLDSGTYEATFLFIFEAA